MNALTYFLCEHLGEQPRPDVAASLTTIMHHGQAAQQWLLAKYLTTWLKTVGDLLACEYPLAIKNARMLRGVGALGLQMAEPRDAVLQLFFMQGVEDRLKDLARGCAVATARSMQWGVWAREIPTAMAYAFGETEVLDPVICQGIAPCCTYAAFVVSQIVTDEGVAEEIAEKMFEDMPRELLNYLDRMPAAPEA